MQVLGHVGNAGGLAGSGGAHRVGVLADDLAAPCDQFVGGFLLGGLIVPGAGEGHVHGDGGVAGLGAQVESGVAGNHFGVGEGADVTQICLNHFAELHAGGNTGQETALIDGG